MNYSLLLRRSIDFDAYGAILNVSYPSELERPLILSLIQTLWDRGEANGYANPSPGMRFRTRPDTRCCCTRPSATIRSRTGRRR